MRGKSSKVGKGRGVVVILRTFATEEITTGAMELRARQGKGQGGEKKQTEVEAVDSSKEQ